MSAGALAIVVMLAGGGQAVPAQRAASASITILRPLAITAIADLSFGRLQPQGNGNSNTATVSAAPPITRTTNGVSALSGGGETPAIRGIVGEPTRAYRITLPSMVSSSQGGYPVTAFKLWTANRGDITATGLSQLSSTGQDTLRIGATITFPKGAKQDIFTANVPITISYE
jgi:hypothetical protein